MARKPTKRPDGPASRRTVERIPDTPAGDRTRNQLEAFPIVGIGASAGGLDAFTALLRALPLDTGMAFILVPHLAPFHTSAMAEILGRATSMPVAEVRRMTTVRPNHVYIIPPGHDMVIADQALHLRARIGHAPHHSVDHFFRSLAEDQGHRAIGVVLSGTASDGTAGLQAIKAQGGITFAQDDSAQQSGMPQSAIAEGAVDFVLAPNEIARELTRISRHPGVGRSQETADPGENRHVRKALQIVYEHAGVDFSGYKPTTLQRRIMRRMVLRKMDRLDEYVKILGDTPAEARSLHQDLLIGVTSFFRNPEAFDALKQTAFPRLVTHDRANDPLRVWVLGCSTGEEAYSLAIALTEFMDETRTHVPLQIFASDLNGAGINTARAGVYAKGGGLN